MSPRNCITRYTINPFRVEDNVHERDQAGFLIQIEYRGLPPCVNRDDEFDIDDDPKWAVMKNSTCYRLVNGKLASEYESNPSSRTEKFKKQYRFTYQKALKVASKLAEEVRADVLRRIELMKERDAS